MGGGRGAQVLWWWMLSWVLLAQFSADTYLDRGNELESTGNFPLAQEQYGLALEAFRQRGETSGQAVTLAKLAFLYIQMEDLDAAVDFSARSISLRQEVTGFDDQRILLDYRALLFTETGQYSQALAAAEEYRQLLLGHADHATPIDWAFYYLDYGNLLIELERYEEAYVALRRGRELPPPDTGRAYAIYECSGLLGYGLLQQKRYREAIPHLEDFITYAVAQRDTNELEDDMQYLATCYEQTAQPERAIEWLRRAHAIRERQLEKSLQATAAGYAAQYRTAERESTIARQRGLIYGGGLLLLTILTALWFWLRDNRRKSRLLRDQNQENEILLKEIHHRVKNNLEIVSSLLELQSATIRDPAARLAMQAGQSRVQSMGLLHQSLYQGKQLSAIEMRAYFRTLTGSLLDTYGAECRIDIHLPMDEIELDIDQALPVGLIVNEVVTNAIKYAYPAPARKGSIHISLAPADRRAYRLVIQDDGVGKAGGHAARAGGFGSRLISLLTQQLNGTLTEVNRGGLRTELTFGNSDRGFGKR